MLSTPLAGGGPKVVVSTAAFHARVRGSVPGLGGLKETKLFLPHQRVKDSIVGSLRDREVACSASDRQGSNFESCVWRTLSSQSSHHPQEVLLAQFSLYVHKGGLKPDSFHFDTLSTPFLRFLNTFLLISTYRPDPSNVKQFVEDSDVYLGGDYPNYSSDGSLEVLIVLKYRQTTALCTLAAAQEARRKKRAAGVFLVGTEKAFSQALLESLLSDPSVSVFNLDVNIRCVTNVVMLVHHSFEYLSYESTAIIYCLILSVRGLTSDVSVGIDFRRQCGDWL